MNEWLNTETRRHLEALLDVATRQHTVAAANIANIDTPGYRARELDFQSAFQEAMARRAPGGDLSAEGGGGSARSRVSVSHLREVDGLPVRNDGNNVDIDRAMLDVNAAGGRYRIAIELLRKQHGLLTYAISEGREGS